MIEFRYTLGMMCESNFEIDHNTVLIKGEDILFRIVDDEAVVVVIETNEVFVLNEVSARVVEILEDATSVELLVERLHHEFDVERAVLEEDVLEHLHELLEQGIVVRSQL